MGKKAASIVVFLLILLAFGIRVKIIPSTFPNHAKHSAYFGLLLVVRWESGDQAKKIDFTFFNLCITNFRSIELLTHFKHSA